MLNPFTEFFKYEASGGIILLICAIIALVLANTDAQRLYYSILHYPLHIGPASLHLDLSLLHWINDGLMAVFFFVIGLEIKREFLYGELKSISATILPISAAIGGMVVPALIYIAINYGQDSIVGWGIPMATDIAFSLGILALVGSTAPRSIALFLTALAIVDDLGAIIVIAIFYNTDVSLIALIIGFSALLIAFLLNRANCKSFLPYLVVGLVAWLAFLNAGIHPTIAGVSLGFLLPADHDNQETSLLHIWEHRLEPWTAYLIMPIFALANAGVTISSGVADIFSSVGLGIILGLFIGKPLGICGASWALIKTKLVPMPVGAKNFHLLGAGTLGGIGFTMSLFIATLAFSSAHHLEIAKISIIIASVLSGIMGIIILKLFKSK